MTPSFPLARATVGDIANHLPSTSTSRCDDTNGAAETGFGPRLPSDGRGSNSLTRG